MEKITGIGGFFFRAKDHKALAEWYERHLGISRVPTSAEGEPWRQEAGVTAFSPFKADSTYFGDPTKNWMLNLRVRDLDAMVAQLRAAKIEVEVNAENYPGIGRFAKLKDPEGNPIELWEPDPSNP
jgi:predicted enzyme related to lactoylglutathione lyase